MESKYLKTFKTILETGSFQKAAERLNYAQSTVTLQMQTLEQEVHVKLFEKIGRKMELTQAGKELLPYVNTVLEAMEQMECFGRRSGDLTGPLHIAMPESLLLYQMQPVIKEFRKQAPHVNLSLQILSCSVIREQVLNGSMDIGIHYDVGGYGSSILMKPLASYPLVLVASPSLNQEQGDFIKKGQRKDLCLLTVDRNSVYHKILAEYLERTEIVFCGEMEIGSIEAVKCSVTSNLGAAFLPRFTVERELKSGLIKELPTGLTNRQITTVCSRHKNRWITPAMELFIRLLEEHLTPEGKGSE